MQLPKQIDNYIALKLAIKYLLTIYKLNFEIALKSI